MEIAGSEHSERSAETGSDKLKQSSSCKSVGTTAMYVNKMPNTTTAAPQHNSAYLATIAAPLASRMLSAACKAHCLSSVTGQSARHLLFPPSFTYPVCKNASDGLLPHDLVRGGS